MGTDVKDFLSEQDAYTLHKPARLHFKRNRVFVTKPLNQFQADLCDMQALADHNDGFKYLLTVKNVSKYFIVISDNNFIVHRQQFYQFKPA